MSERILLRSPKPKEMTESHLFNYMSWLSQHGYPHFSDYNSLYKWSVSEIELFWESIWHWGKIIFHEPYRHILPARVMPGADWFQGSKLNFAENLLEEVTQDPGRELLFTHTENGQRVSFTGVQLVEQVAKFSAYLKSVNVKPGDRVAAIVVNSHEALVAMLATTSLGAIWSSCSPDFGAEGILDRFGQIKPKVIIVTDGYVYGGKAFSRVDRITEILKNLPATEHVVWISRLGEKPQGIPLTKSVSLWSDIQKQGPQKLVFESLPFAHPVYILFSSGTTGKPKCIMHGAGGVLLQHKKELLLHANLQERDQFLYYTTTGWMMWNWMASSLMTKAVLHLYDGAPNYPNLEGFWSLLQNEQISVFGTSAKFLAACRSAKLFDGPKNGVPELRTLLSTGSPLLPEDFQWVYKNLSKDVLLSSISGGTDIVSCFFLGNPLLPVYQGELQCRGLGMAVEAYSEKGQPLVGDVGELVCTLPAPSMPVAFWDDSDGEKYRGAYFDKFPSVWCHGDFVKILPDGAAIIYGRSDATLNPGGIRIGTSEIYSQVETLDEIADSLVVSQPWQGDERIILFVVLRPNRNLDDVLTTKIRSRIKEGTTPRHVPAKIIAVKEIPYTVSGKKVELAVSRMLRGMSVDNQHALSNPASLLQFSNLAELQS